MKKFRKRFWWVAVVMLVFGAGMPTQATQLPMPTVCKGTLVRNHKGVLRLESANERCNGIILKRLTKMVVKSCKIGGACWITGRPGGDYSDDHKDDDYWFDINSRRTLTLSRHHLSGL
jgi:hypothetical protein